MAHRCRTALHIKSVTLAFNSCSQVLSVFEMPNNLHSSLIDSALICLAQSVLKRCSSDLNLISRDVVWPCKPRRKIPLVINGFRSNINTIFAFYIFVETVCTSDPKKFYTVFIATAVLKFNPKITKIEHSLKMNHPLNHQRAQFSFKKKKAKNICSSFPLPKIALLTA